MADWMNQMANAVDEYEAANAPPQDEGTYRTWSYFSKVSSAYRGQLLSRRDPRR